MQNTRLNNLIDLTASRLGQWFNNPWRRFSFLALSLFFGFFLGNAVSTISGQKADLDIVAAAILLLITELISRLVYGGDRLHRQALWVAALNWLKIGVTYSLFLDAFKLGS